MTFSCTEPVFVAMTFTSPQSFLWLSGVTEPSSLGTSVGLQFRTWNKAGLLLTFDLPKQGGAAWLYLSKARLHLQIHKSGRAPLELSAGQSDPKPLNLNLNFLTSSVRPHLNSICVQLNLIRVQITFKNSQHRCNRAGVLFC